MGRAGGVGIPGCLAGGSASPALGLPTFSTSFSALWALFQESQDTLSSIDPLPWVSAQGPTSSPLAWESIQEL